jgi:hypothetical protein
MTSHKGVPKVAAYLLAFAMCASTQALGFDTAYGQMRDWEDAEAGRYGTVAMPTPFAEAPLPRPAGFASWSTVDRDDYEANEFHAQTTAETLCVVGGRSTRFHKPAYACQAAARDALEERDFDNALDYAFIGCTRHVSGANCREAAIIPLRMGMAGMQPPRSMAVRLQKLAHGVCSAGVRIVDIMDRDITGRECAHVARQFVLARDPEYRFALSPAARAFYEAIYDQGRAVRLMGDACNRGDLGVCEARFALGRQMDPRDVADTLAMDDAEAGRPIRSSATVAERNRALETMAKEGAAVLAGRRALIIALADLDELTETLEREAGDRIRAANAGRLCMRAGEAADGEASSACWTAYQHAHDTAQFELALRYAVAGCERHRDAASCRLAASLPLRMLERKITPGPLFASELKRLGKVVCLGGAPVTNTARRDVTGRICHHYASLLTPVQASIGATSGDRVERYLISIRDAASADELHQAACMRHSHYDSCGAHVARRITKQARRAPRSH